MYKNTTDPVSPIGYARQTGLENANGKYICTTDADCIVPETWLVSLIRALDQDEDVACVTGHTRHYGATLPLRVCDMSNDKTRKVGTFIQSSHATGQNMAFRRSDALFSGGYDLDALRDDMALCHRLQTLGRKHLIDSADAAVFVSPRRVNEEGIFRTRVLFPFGFNNGSHLDADGRLKQYR